MASFIEITSDINFKAKLKIVTDLQLYLEEEDIVILIDINGANFLTEILCRAEILKKSLKKAVIISTVNFPMKPGDHIYRTVSESEMDALLNIYRLYEVSDKLILFSDSKNYGNAWNYVNNGLISEEEMLEALFI